MLLRVIEGEKSQWILKDLWIQVVIEDDAIDEVFLAGGKEQKQMPARGKVQGVELLFGKNNFSMNCSESIRN